MKKYLLLSISALLALTACGASETSSSQETTSLEPTSIEPTSQEEPSEDETSEELSYDTSDIRIIAPTGAPTLALYNKIDQLTTNSTPSNVGAQLQADNYDAVVFDFYNGLKSIKNNNGHYKLARILTAGNLYLVGINKEGDPQEGDVIVSFGEGLLPDLAFNEIYGNSGATVKYVTGGVSAIPSVMTNAMYLGEKVDYVVIAEPVLTSTLSTVEDKSIYHKTLISEKWKELKGEDALIPQAGLFINMNSYENNEEKYQQFLEEINEDIASGLENPTLIKEAFESVGDTNAQKDRFGIPGAMAFKVTNSGNGVGLVSSYTSNVISSFLSDIGNSEDYSAYIL